MARLTGTFLWQFARSPFATGSLVPSSRWLATETVTAIPSKGQPLVVELGPGTGAITQAIQSRLAGRGNHLAVELNPRFAELIESRFPAVDVVNADAARLPELVRSRGFGQVDTIVSGLPWAMFSEELQDSLLEAVVASLAPDGGFATFAYLHALWTPPARRFRERLRASFDEVVVGGTVWRNVPPALVYFARQPRIPANLQMA
ncbi:MAG TPA: methyltransferase domain-containing protein [Micromonosporaceae bacterium]|jgi:phospholipid N-methyltransferase